MDVFVLWHVVVDFVDVAFYYRADSFLINCAMDILHRFLIIDDLRDQHVILVIGTFSSGFTVYDVLLDVRESFDDVFDLFGVNVFSVLQNYDVL